MNALIGMAAAAAIAATGALGPAGQGPEDTVSPPIHTVEDAIIWCADYFDDPFEALDCMDAAELSDLPTSWELANIITT